MDIKWLKESEGTDNRTLSELMGELEAEKDRTKNAVEHLKVLLKDVIDLQ